jgi:hypothetical protein
LPTSIQIGRDAFSYGGLSSGSANAPSSATGQCGALTPTPMTNALTSDLIPDLRQKQLTIQIDGEAVRHPGHKVSGRLLDRVSLSLKPG